MRYTFFPHMQTVYKQLALRSKVFKQLPELDHFARSNSKKSNEGNFSNITSEESAITP